MEDNDLVIEGVKVSRYHAVVVEMGGGFAVNDLRSTNGTLVGEQRVLDSHFLRSGDVIRIGGTDITFEMEALTEQPTVLKTRDFPGLSAIAEAFQGRGASLSQQPHRLTDKAPRPGGTP